MGCSGGSNAHKALGRVRGDEDEAEDTEFTVFEDVRGCMRGELLHAVLVHFMDQAKADNQQCLMSGAGSYQATWVCATPAGVVRPAGSTCHLCP